MFNILCIGDVIGKTGRDIVRSRLPFLIKEHDIQFVILNGENSAGGFGITKPIYDEFKAMGVHVVTTGNHVYDKRDILKQFDLFKDMVRPLNFPPGAPGKGIRIFESHYATVAVVNLMGRVFMPAYDCPFQVINAHLSQILKETPIVIVDFHTEATSEINAMGLHLDGKVSAVFGTHTHIQTADCRVLEGQTAFISDLGMVGSENSILGMKKGPIIKQFMTGLPSKKEPEDLPPYILSAMVVSVDPHTGKALSAKSIYDRVYELK